MASSKNTLRALYIDELRDLYSAEKQLTKAIPKLAKAANSEELSAGFLEHLEQTKGHVQRLEEIFEMLGERPTGKKCVGIEGLVQEGGEVISSGYEGAVMDAALIGAAQRVEHYEIAAYGTVCAMAELLDETEQASLLNETLQEEKETDEKLSQIADEVNPQAMQVGSEDADLDEGDEEENVAIKPASSKPRRTRKVA
jgi:ferritin-like metal-binding protein YciE